MLKPPLVTADGKELALSVVYLIYSIHIRGELKRKHLLPWAISS